MNEVRYRTSEVARFAEVTLRQLQVWEEKGVAVASRSGRVRLYIHRKPCSLSWWPKSDDAVYHCNGFGGSRLHSVNCSMTMKWFPAGRRVRSPLPMAAKSSSQILQTKL